MDIYNRPVNIQMQHQSSAKRLDKNPTFSNLVSCHLYRGRRRMIHLLRWLLLRSRSSSFWVLTFERLQLLIDESGKLQSFQYLFTGIAPKLARKKATNTYCSLQIQSIPCHQYRKRLKNPIETKTPDRRTCGKRTPLQESIPSMGTGQHEKPLRTRCLMSLKQWCIISEEPGAMQTQYRS